MLFISKKISILTNIREYFGYYHKYVVRSLLVDLDFQGRIGFGDGDNEDPV